MTGSRSLRITRLFTAVLVMLCVAAPGFAQRPGTAEGYWKGMINTPKAKEVLVWLNRNPEGAWGGTIDIPVDGVKEYPLIVTGEGRTATFRIPGPSGQTFKGTLSADANKLTGDYADEGKTYPFELIRQPGPPPPVVSASDKAVGHARRVVELLRQDKFADVAKELNAQTAAALPTATLRERWLALRTQLGAYKSEISHTADQVTTLYVVTLGIQFERGTHNVVIVIDANDKISGIQFAPRPK